MKAPNSKLQVPEKHQTLSSKAELIARRLDVGAWSFSGAWMLVLGAFSV
jgi:hypothetical protein